MILSALNLKQILFRKGLKRMEELKKAFYEVMYKYEKSFGETGVMTNLNLWAQEKAGLLELLRRHPNWDEDAKAIVFSFDEGRGIQRESWTRLLLLWRILPPSRSMKNSVWRFPHCSACRCQRVQQHAVRANAGDHPYPWRYKMRRGTENQPDHRQAVPQFRCGRA